MVKLNKIYTRTGDAGTTGLGTGKRVDKFDLRIAAFGTVDELNAVIGLVRLHTGAGPRPGGDLDPSFDDLMPRYDDMLARVQNDLFDLGADLCVPQSDEPPKFEPLRIVESQVDRLEAQIDDLNSNLSPLKSFILPGGSPASSYLHLARTVCRRAERLIVELAQSPDELVSEAAMKYINRLSDFLFVLGRVANDMGTRDVLWVPGKNR